MRFTPKSEKEIVEMGLLPKGEYSFDVISCEERVSKKGAPMLVLTLKLYDQSLQPRGRVTDYLLESMPHKLRHAAYGCGIGDKYETGDLEPHDFNNATGVVRVGIQQDKTGQYPDKNVVLDYLDQTKVPVQKIEKNFQNFQADEDVPF